MAQRVLICGVGGIGRALALRLYKKGTNVHLVARSKDKLEALQTELHQLRPGGAEITVADASDPAKFEEIVRSSVATSSSTSSPSFSGFVYAVGSIPLKPLKSTTAKDFLDAYNLNFLSGALALKALAASSASSQQSLRSAVFFSTVACRVGFPNHTAIAAAKGAVEAFVRSSGAELAPRTRVNCIAPSLTDTPLASRLLPPGAAGDSMRKALGEAHPIPRVGTADDSAALADFLLDDSLSGWISGQVFSVDGGRSTLRPKN